MLQEFGDPSAILHVRLAPGHLFDMGRINELDAKVPFEQIENGLPVHPGTLHSDDHTPLGLEPRTGDVSQVLIPDQRGSPNS